MIAEMEIPIHLILVRVPLSLRMKKMKVDREESNRAVEEDIGVDEEDNEDITPSYS